MSKCTCIGLKKKGKYILCGDNGKHFNHSPNANTKNMFFNSKEEAWIYYSNNSKKFITEQQFDQFDWDEGFTVASKDIVQGEEITSNYLTDFPDEGPVDHHSFLK